MPDLIQKAQDRSAIYRIIRRHFDKAGFLEVETPLLTPHPIPESSIELFATESLQNSQRLYLVPSPEVWMKSLLAEGAPSLYQISRCFRNGEHIDTWHRPEFTMLEWYALDVDAEANIERMQALFEECRMQFCPNAKKTISRRITMDEAFEEYAGFSLKKDLTNLGWSEIIENRHAEDERNRATCQLFCSRLKERGLPFEIEDSAEDLFHRIFVSLVEENLLSDQPLYVTQWPSLIPTLAKRLPETPWAQRWEMYYRGVELANCYTEENNLRALQRYARIEGTKKKRALVPLSDNDAWMGSIATGLPHCSGAAVGIDRLLAVIRGNTSLRGLDLFPMHASIER